MAEMARKRRRFSAAFKAEIVRLVLSGRSKERTAGERGARAVRQQRVWLGETG